MALRLKANRRFPSLPVVNDNPENHTQVLMAVKEALDIGQRRTGDLLNSFIRVEDLIDLGLITIEGNTNAIVGADLSEIADIGDLSGAAIGDFLRFDGTEWVNDQLAPGDITQTMVTQHQAALSINWSQIAGEPTIPTVLDDLTDVDLSTPPNEDDVLTFSSGGWIAAPAPGSGSVAYLDDLLDVDVPYPNPGDVLVFDGYGWVNEPSDTIDLAYGIDWYDHFFYQGTTGGNTWDFVVTGAGAAFDFFSDADHPGISRTLTGTTTTGSSLAFLTSSQADANLGRCFTPPTSTPLIVTALVRIAILPTLTEDFAGRWGLNNNSSTERIIAVARHSPVTGNPVWRITVIAASVTTSVDAAFGPSANTWHHIRLEITTSLVALYVDGVFAASVTTGIPTAAMTLHYGNVKIAGTTSRGIETDFMRVYRKLSAPLFVY